MDLQRVIFSHRETFTFKPADVPDVPVVIQGPRGPREVSAAAVLSPAALAESRKEHQRQAVVNTFCDWGKAAVPEGAFYFRHQWCEPVRTGAGASGHGINKHAIRFTRGMVQRSQY
jgi:hypothetical protein